MHKNLSTFWKRFWYNDEGTFVIVQWPNLPIMAWAVFLGVTKIARTGALHNGAQFISSAALVTWAYLEITAGSTYFRRVLGVVILFATIVSHTR